jgi:hypothetical protein
MLYRIEKATAHPDHTVTITWSDGVEASVDLGPVVAKGKVFTAMQDPAFFVEQWPNRVDFSADGLRFMAFPGEAEEEFGALPTSAATS